MVKVYILGEARGAHRIQNFVKMLLDDRKHYKVYYDSLFYSNRLFRYLKSLIINPFVILRSDVVYVCTLNVDINIFYELIWAKILRKKVLVDFYVSVFDTVVLDRKWFKEGGIMAKLAILCDKLFLALSNKCIFFFFFEKKHYMDIVGFKGKLDPVIIPLGTPEKPIVKKGFLSNKRNTLNICWWGSYQPLHGLENVLQAARLLKLENLPIRWFFCGNDAEKEKCYINIAAENDVSDICMFSTEYTFNNGRLQKFLQENCDIALGAFGTSEKAKVITNKFVEACSMKCIALTRNSENVREFFGDSVFMSDTDPESIAKKIHEIYCCDKNLLIEKAEKAYSYYLQTFTVEKMQRKMKQILEQLE